MVKNTNSFSFFSGNLDSLKQEISLFIDILINKGLMFRAMFDPHQGWLKEQKNGTKNKALLSPTYIKYRLQLHLAPPIGFTSENCETLMLEIQNFLYRHMDKYESFFEFEKTFIDEFLIRFGPVNDNDNTKLLPGAPEDESEYLASDGFSSKEQDGAGSSLKEKKESLISFISPNVDYTWNELMPEYFDSEQGNQNMRLWEDFNEGYKLGCCSIGFQDWTGGITIRGAFIYIKNGEEIEYSLSQDPTLRFKEKKEIIEKKLIESGELESSDIFGGKFRSSGSCQL